MTGGAIAQLAVSSNSATGYRTNLVVMNPGTASATATVRVRAAGGALLSTGTIGPLGANGFSQVGLDNAGTFPGMAGRTDTNLWLEFTSNQPVLAFASVINNASGDPFAVVATPDALGAVPTQGAWDGTWSGSWSNGAGWGGTVSFDVISNQVVKIIYGGRVSSSTSCSFGTFVTPQPGYPVGSNGSFTFSVPAAAGSIGVSGTGNFTMTGTGSGLYNFTVSANSVPGSSCSGTGSATFSATRRAPAPAHQSWDGTWSGSWSNGSGWGGTVSFDVVSNQVVKIIYGGRVSTDSSSTSCSFDTFVTPQPGYPVDGNGSFTVNIPAAAGSIGIKATGNLATTGSGTGLYDFSVTANSVPGYPSCSGMGSATFSVSRVGGPPPHP